MRLYERGPLWCCGALACIFRTPPVFATGYFGGQHRSGSRQAMACHKRMRRVRRLHSKADVAERNDRQRVCER